MTIPHPSILLCAAAALVLLVASIAPAEAQPAGTPASPEVIEAVIDVAPDDLLNRVALTDREPVSVALFGSEELDVLRIDRDSLAFGPWSAAPAVPLEHPMVMLTSLADVNRDGRFDLVAPFSVQESGLAMGDSSVCLRGTTGGIPFSGCNDVVVTFSGGGFFVGVSTSCGLGFELIFVIPLIARLRSRRGRSLG